MQQHLSAYTGPIVAAVRYNMRISYNENSNIWN
jgi:hypothetical protein